MGSETPKIWLLNTDGLNPSELPTCWFCFRGPDSTCLLCSAAVQHKPRLLLFPLSWVRGGLGCCPSCDCCPHPYYHLGPHHLLWSLYPLFSVVFRFWAPLMSSVEAVRPGPVPHPRTVCWWNLGSPSLLCLFLCTVRDDSAFLKGGSGDKWVDGSFKNVSSMC